ncbi:MAG: hypothetical protein KDK99_18165 [Verrucomicrobiales bacterium]|nr:hypothetical protein [Verrucomicrobiales bacterium]
MAWIAPFVSGADITVHRGKSITKDEFKQTVVLRLAGQGTKVDGKLSSDGDSYVFRVADNGEYSAIVWSHPTMWSESPICSHTFIISDDKDADWIADRPTLKVALIVKSEVKLTELFPRLDFVPCRIQMLEGLRARRYAFQWVALKVKANGTLGCDLLLDPGDYILSIPFPAASEGWPPLPRFECSYLATPFSFQIAKDGEGPQTVFVSLMSNATSAEDVRQKSQRSRVQGESLNGARN